MIDEIFKERLLAYLKCFGCTNFKEENIQGNPMVIAQMVFTFQGAPLNFIILKEPSRELDEPYQIQRIVFLAAIKPEEEYQQMIREADKAFYNEFEHEFMLHLITSRITGQIKHEKRDIIFEIQDIIALDNDIEINETVSARDVSSILKTLMNGRGLIINFLRQKLGEPDDVRPPRKGKSKSDDDVLTQ